MLTFELSIIDSSPLLQFHFEVFAPAAPAFISIFILVFPLPPPGWVALRLMCANILFGASAQPFVPPSLLLLSFYHPSSCLLPSRSNFSSTYRAKSSLSPLPLPRPFMHHHATTALVAGLTPMPTTPPPAVDFLSSLFLQC